VIGTVRVKISSLQFIAVQSIGKSHEDNPVQSNGRRQEDSRIVNNLAGVFHRTKIRRYDPKNVIRALVTPAELRNALNASGITQTVPTSPAPDGSLRLLKTVSIYFRKI
jgi:hypothetical protein